MADSSFMFEPSSMISRTSTASDLASAASSKASEAMSRITARSAIWDRKTVCLKAKEDTSAVADGDGIKWTVPDDLSGMDLVSCGVHVYTAPTSTIMQLKISNIGSAVQMLTSNMTIDVNEKDTNTAASQAVINTAADGIATGEELRFYASEAGSGAKGLEFRATFKKP